MVTYKGFTTGGAFSEVSWPLVLIRELDGAQLVYEYIAELCDLQSRQLRTRIIYRAPDRKLFAIPHQIRLQKSLDEIED